MSTETTSKVSTAVDRLNKILPLKAGQQKLDPQLASLYRNILTSYVDISRSLNRDEIAAQVDDIDAAIGTLKQYGLVVFDANDEPVGAYPFTMEARVHRVKVNDHEVHCMCALDALSVSPMFCVDTEINSECAVSGEVINIRQHNGTIVNAGQNADVRFGINWSAATGGCCATSLCTEMLFLKDEPTAVNWLAEDPDNREIFRLDDAIAFAAGFFVPLMRDEPVCVET